MAGPLVCRRAPQDGFTATCPIKELRLSPSHEDVGCRSIAGLGGIDAAHHDPIALYQIVHIARESHRFELPGRASFSHPALTDLWTSLIRFSSSAMTGNRTVSIHPG